MKFQHAFFIKRTPKEQQDMRLIKESAVEAAKAWSIVEQQLSHSLYIAGDRFSMGDIGMWAHRYCSLRVLFLVKHVLLTAIAVTSKVVGDEEELWSGGPA